MPFSLADLTLPTRSRFPVAGLLTATLLAVAAVAPANSFAQAAPIAAPAEEARALLAVDVLNEMQSLPELRIPDTLLRRAQGIAIIPDMARGALLIGGRGGKGVLLVRNTDGQWSNPAFITVGGLSFGWQFGVQTVDVVLVFTTRESIEGVTGGKLTLGADASIAVGPLGRQASGATDTTFASEVYAYSRAKGLFAGIALDGGVVAMDRKANARFYQKPGVLASEILAPSAPQPPFSGQRVTIAVSKLTEMARNPPAPRPSLAPPMPPTSSATPATPAATVEAAPAAPLAPASEAALAPASAAALAPASEAAPAASTRSLETAQPAPLPQQH
jgi:lipid-binding SYLF domain-containing protein